MTKHIFFSLLFCSMLISCQQDKNTITEQYEYTADDLMAIARKSAAKYGLEDSVEMFYLIRNTGKTLSTIKTEYTEKQIEAQLDTTFKKARAGVNKSNFAKRIYQERWDMLLRIQSKREYFEYLEQNPDLFRWTYGEKGMKEHLAEKAEFLSDKWFLAVDKEGAVVWTPEPYEGEGRRINQQ
jgi:hypothetical protein